MGVADRPQPAARSTLRRHALRRSHSRWSSCSTESSAWASGFAVVTVAGGTVTVAGGTVAGALIGMGRPSLCTLSERLTATLTDGTEIVKRSARRACEQGSASGSASLLPLIPA